MLFKKFYIRNYKAIEDLSVSLSKNVIPIIGVNESGKTSILQAILAFDKDKDSLLGGGHISPKNKYTTNQAPCQLMADVEIEDKNEFQEIGEEIGLKMNNPLYEWLESIDNHRSISISRNYDGTKFLKSYSLITEEEKILSNSKTSTLINAIVRKLPNILYFDDFSDRVPESVSFPENYIETDLLVRGKDREWQEIVVEIFSRAVEEEFSLKHFLQLTDEDDRDNWLSDVESTLNREIIEEWSNLKRAFTSFSEDSDTLQLSIKYSVVSGKPTFKFKVIDSEDLGKDRFFDVTQRSKGFQWFFNFIMKLKFNPKYKSSPENAIYLLDEPGSYLHSSAQVELLKKLCDIGKKNTILYCTHSQYLLDPDVINISSIKIASKSDGRINLQDYGNSNYTRSLGAFSALYDALHLKFGFKEQMLRKCILVEGIVDYYFFNMFLGFKSFNVIPGAGCSQLRELISILISCSEKFVVVLDNDKEGRLAFQDYSRFFGKSFIDRTYQYNGVSKNETFVLEDLLSANDSQRIQSAMKCEDIKNAIIALYFTGGEIKKGIIESIDQDTNQRITIVRERIKAMFK